jgi:DNA-binding NarL/FixJ family response regulator
MQNLVKEVVDRGSGSMSLSKKLSLRLTLAESIESVRQSIVDELKQDNHIISVCNSLEELIQTFSNEEPDVLLIGNLPEASCLEVYRQCTNRWAGLPIAILSYQPSVNEFFRTWVVAKGVYDVLSSYPNNLYLLRESLQKIGSNSAPIANLPVAEAIEAKADGKTETQSELIPVSAYLAKPQAPSHGKVLSQFHETPIRKDPRLEDLLESIPETHPKENRVATPLNLSHNEVLTALNQITDYSMNYFGAMAIGNYWKKTQANTVLEHPWLECWTVDFRGAIAYFSEAIPSEKLTSEQVQSLKVWVKCFLNECDRIIVDYSQMLAKMGVSEHVKQIIS